MQEQYARARSNSTNPNLLAPHTKSWIQFSTWSPAKLSFAILSENKTIWNILSHRTDGTNVIRERSCLRWYKSRVLCFPNNILELKLQFCVRPPRRLSSGILFLPFYFPILQSYFLTTSITSLKCNLLNKSARGFQVNPASIVSQSSFQICVKLWEVRKCAEHQLKNNSIVWSRFESCGLAESLELPAYTCYGPHYV